MPSHLARAERTKRGRSNFDRNPNEILKTRNSPTPRKHMFGQPLPSGDPGQQKAAALATRLETAWPPGRFRRTASWPPIRIRLISCGWRACTLIASTTSIVTEAAATTGQSIPICCSAWRRRWRPTNLPGAAWPNAGANSPAQPAAPTPRSSPQPARSAPRSRLPPPP